MKALLQTCCIKKIGNDPNSLCMALYVVGKLGFSSNAYSFSWWLVADVDLF
jgi:hypothetical protein